MAPDGDVYPLCHVRWLHTHINTYRKKALKLIIYYICNRREDNTVVQTGTIREVRQRLIENGFHVSEYALRRWIKTGVLPAAFAGNKALISYTNVIKLLERGQVLSE